MEGGHRAVIFDRFTGVSKEVVGEGTHFFVPWVQRPIMYDIRSRPRNVPVITGSKGNLINKQKKMFQLSNYIFLFFFSLDLQNVNITLRILFRPIPSSLPNIYSTLGIDYDERVLPSITNEILKAVVVSTIVIVIFFIS